VRTRALENPALPTKECVHHGRIRGCSRTRGQPHSRKNNLPHTVTPLAIVPIIFRGNDLQILRVSRQHCETVSIGNFPAWQAWGSWCIRFTNFGQESVYVVVNRKAKPIQYPGPESSLCRRGSQGLGCKVVHMVRIPKATPTPSENTPVDRRIVRHPQVQTPMELETAMGTAQHGKHVHLMLKIGIHQYPIKEPSLKLDHPGGSGCMHTMATPLPHDPVRGMEEMAGYFNAIRNSRRLDTLAVPTSHIQYPATGEKSSGRTGVTSFEPGKEGPDPGHAAAQRGRALLLAFLECFLKGQRINQVVLSWRVEQKHKTAACAASDFPGVAIILWQAPSRTPRAFAHRALPGL